MTQLRILVLENSNHRINRDWASNLVLEQLLHLKAHPGVPQKWYVGLLRCSLLVLLFESTSVFPA